MSVTVFNEDMPSILIPGQSIDPNAASLMTQGLEEAIVKKEIKAVLVGASTEVESPSYLIDMSEVELVTEEALRALQGLFAAGDTAIYMKNNDVTFKIGYGDSQELYLILSTLLKHMFNSKVKLFKNKGKGFEPNKDTDISLLRLNI